MDTRSAELQGFLDHARAALALACDAPARSLVDRIFTRLEQPAPRAATAPVRLPACAQLEPALALTRANSPEMARVAESFVALEPEFTWRRSPRTTGLGEAFERGYASAIVVGTDGVEIRDDVRIGISLMAPELRYPDHDHPPEEIYLVLSGGEWRQASGAWFAPGSGGFVHNPPHIVHAMRSTETPLLAIWFLLM